MPTLYDEDYNPVEVEYVDDRGFTLEERMAAMEAAIAASQGAAEAYGYEDEDEDYEDDDEEAWLDELSWDMANLEIQLGRELTQDEVDTLAAGVMGGELQRRSRDYNDAEIDVALTALALGVRQPPQGSRGGWTR